MYFQRRCQLNKDGATSSALMVGAPFRGRADERGRERRGGEGEGAVQVRK